MMKLFIHHFPPLRDFEEANGSMLMLGGHHFRPEGIYRVSNIILDVGMVPTPCFKDI